MYESVLNEILVGGHHSTILTVLLYVTRPGIVAVILMAMLLGVYYLRSVAKAREHVVGILQDILRLEAEDKKFLLKSISKFSERSKYNASSRQIVIIIKMMLFYWQYCTLLSPFSIFFFF